MAEFGIETTPAGVSAGIDMSHTHAGDPLGAQVLGLGRREALNADIAPQGQTAGSNMGLTYGTNDTGPAAE